MISVALLAIYMSRKRCSVHSGGSIPTVPVHTSAIVRGKAMRHLPCDILKNVKRIPGCRSLQLCNAPRVNLLSCLLHTNANYVRDLHIRPAVHLSTKSSTELIQYITMALGCNRTDHGMLVNLQKYRAALVLAWKRNGSGTGTCTCANKSVLMA